MNKIIKVNANTVIKIKENDIYIKQYNEFENTYDIIVLSANDIEKIRGFIKRWHNSH